MTALDLLNGVRKKLSSFRLWISTGYLADHKIALAVSATLVLGSMIVSFASFFERTVVLPGDGRGLSNHYGIWAIFIGSPFLVILASVTYSKFTGTVGELGRYTIGDELPEDLRVRIGKHLASLHCERYTRYLLGLCLVAGWYFWLVNVRQTIYPFDSYGNDVFDAYPHILGFLTFKIYLAFLWGLVYPALAYLTLHMFISLINILKYMSDNELFRLDFFHEDNCGGVSVFGTINLMMLSMSFLVFVTVLSILFTHKGTYSSIWISVAVSFALIVGQSVGGVYYIHIFVRKKRAEVLRQINEVLNTSIPTTDGASGFPQDLLSLRNHIATIRSFPYARGARFLVNLLRLSPAAVGLANIIWSLQP